MPNFKNNLIWCLAAVPVLLLPARAEALTLPIDPNASSLQIELLVFGNPVATPQLPGSDVANLGGTLEVEFPSANEIAFPGGSNIIFLNYDGGATPLEPGPGGSDGSAPAAYGLDLLLTPASGVGALRDATAEVTGATKPIIGNAFDPTELTLALTAGTLDAFLTLGQTEIREGLSVAGNSAENSNATDGFVDQALALVILPVDAEVTVDVEIADGVILPITAHFTGQVATVPVPEPSSLALMGMAVLALPAVCYRRWRRR